MPWYARPNVRPMLGSAALHLLFVVILLLAAMRWRSEPPATPLAIEGNVVRYEDLPRSVRSGRPISEHTTKTAETQSTPRPAPEPKPVVKKEPSPDAAAAVAAEALKQQQAELERTQAREASQR